ncbi:MAG: TonB-dependent receptor [Bacteroidales bacterium]
MFERSSDYTSPSRASRRIIAAYVVIFAWLLCPETIAQDLFLEDTVNISAVTVTASSAARFAPGTIVRIDSSLLARHEGSDMASLLHSSGILSVKRYGNHGLASVSIRGMSGSHTAVTWNGLPLNSPGNGYTDLAIIPLFSVTNVRITPGGSALDDITGSIGGQVELSSEPVFNGLTEVSLAAGAGSFGEYSSSAVFGTGTEKILLKLSIWGETARNNFRYINKNAPGGAAEECRVNASAATAGVATDLAFRLKGSLLSAHIWYNDADRELPGPVTTVQQDFGERQRDRSLRSVLRYTSKPGRVSAEVMAGGSHDVNLYFHENPGFNGDNRSETYIVSTRVSYRAGSSFEMVINAGDEFRKASALSYQDTKVQNILSASLAAKYSPVPRLRLLLQARQMAATGISVTPEFTAGASWLLSAGGEHVVKAIFSRNTKLPCLNDLYWVPGGNPDLVPETATGGEASWSFARVAQSGMRHTLDLTLHASGVDNLIQWLPGTTGIWTAENVRSINVTGIEARAGTEASVRSWKIKCHLSYAFTSSRIAGSDIANDRSVGRQLIYTPLHHLNLNIETGWKALSAGISAVAESRRYTTSDNSEWLPACITTDLFIGAGFRSGITGIRADLYMNNLLNTSSESIRNYPMPLRTINLRIKLTWSQKQKKHESNL